MKNRSPTGRKGQAEWDSIFQRTEHIIVIQAHFHYNDLMKQEKISGLKHQKQWKFLQLTVFAITVSFLLYAIYYLFAPFLWEQNVSILPEQLTPWLRPWNRQRDGWEIYALYVLMFANILLTLTIPKVISFLTKNARSTISVISVLFALIYFFILGLHPPMAAADYSNLGINDYYPVFVVVFLTIIVYALQAYLPKAVTWLVALLLIPVCFIATQPIQWLDYAFIFAPALKMMQGADIPSLYFQYDIFLSLISALWMKLGLNIDFFSIIGQLSYYVLIFGIFLFSRKIFFNKGLSVFLLVSLILIKIYAGPEDSVHSFQVTPLRLDLWFPLLLLISSYGYRHWTVGLFLGTIMILHKNFGLIYAMAYLEFVLTLAAVDVYFRDASALWPRRAKKFLVEIYRSKNNLIILAAALILGIVFFSGSAPDSSNIYQKIGIGFSRISENSFYWYVPILLNISFILLTRYTKFIPRKSLIVGFALIYLSIGNSLYFFGRSHENNILNISASIVLLLYFCVDIVDHLYCGHKKTPSQSFWKIQTVIFPLISIILMVGFYEKNITEKITVQLENLRHGRFTLRAQPSSSEMINRVELIQSVTKNSQKVYFLSDNDFRYYYYGRYVIPTGITPFFAWTFQEDVQTFLNTLLDQGYVLIIDKPARIGNVLERITYNRIEARGPLIFIWQE